MKKNRYIWKCIATVAILFAFNINGYAQNSLTNKQWEQRTHEILPGLKQEWGKIPNRENETLTRSTGSSRADLLNAEYLPVPCFIMDHDSYMNLTSESNLEFLMKLDTTRVEYLIFDPLTKTMISHSSGRLIDGQWMANGFGGTPSSVENNSRLYKQNTPVYGFRVYISPRQTWGYEIFYENGRLMCFRPDIPTPQPLLETLLEFREIRLANPRRR